MKPFDVLGMKVRVQVIEHFSQLTGNVGLWLPEQKLVQLDSSLKGEELTHTILHELGHAVFLAGGLYSTSISQDVQEVITDQFATMVMANYKLQRR